MKSSLSLSLLISYIALLGVFNYLFRYFYETGNPLRHEYLHGVAMINLFGGPFALWSGTIAMRLFKNGAIKKDILLASLVPFIIVGLPLIYHVHFLWVRSPANPVTRYIWR